MIETLHVKVRQEQGSNAMRRLRRAGMVPAVLYGHGQQNVNLALTGDEVRQLIQHGAKLVDLKGEITDSALIRAVQWDTFGGEVLHVDFARVSAGERVQVRVPIVLRGEAPGSRAGGIVEHILHELEIECPVSALPDRIELNINTLELGQDIVVSQLPLAEGVTPLADGDQLVVHCVLPEVTEEEVAAATETAEPEVIGRKEGGEEEESA